MMNCPPGMGASFEIGFARRQTPESSFAHFTGPTPDETDYDLLLLVREHLGKAIPVNKERTILRVSVPVEGFWTAVRPLQEGDVVRTTFAPRAPGEEAVLRTVMTGVKVPAKHVEIILYHRDALGSDASTDADWEVVSINASPYDGPIPMDPTTMARNQLQKTGGTFQRLYTPEEWAESAWFWSTHANVEPAAK